MKKILFISIAIFLSIEVIGQSQTILRDSTVINIAVKSFFGRTLGFYAFVPELNSSTIDIGEVIGLNGEIPEYRKAAILKKNPAIVFNNERQVIPKVYQRQVNPLSDPGKHLINAGTLYLTGTCLALGGTMITVFSKDDDLVKVGGIVSLGGFICTIVGHTKLIKAGSSIANKPIAIGLAENGVGVSIKF